MHRYPAPVGGNSIGQNTGGGAIREAARVDPAFSSSLGYSTTARRILPPYKLKCDREPLNSRIGPPDYYPPAPNCAEESLSRESCQSGYKETIDGIEEPKEAAYSLVGNSFWTRDNVTRYKESIRKRLRAVTNALIRKRKAGQLYGIPLSGPSLAKPGLFPEQHTCGEDFRKKWIEDLSQRKRLCLLADHVPHGYRRRTLPETLVKHNVPLLRATWFVKVIYLNQVRPLLSGASGGGGGLDKSHAKRVELWTKELLEYAQFVLDELCKTGLSKKTQQQHIGDLTSSNNEVGDSDLLSKWHYIVRLVQWQYDDGLLHQSHIVDWALRQVQEKDSLEVFELMLPIILESLDNVSVSQLHVRMMVDICIHWLKRLCPSGLLPDGNEQSHQLHLTVALTELLRYLLVAVPDTFVAFDCFPLPPCVYDLDGKLPSLSENKDLGLGAKEESLSLEASNVGNNLDRNKSEGSVSYRESFLLDVVQCVQKRAMSLVKAVSPGLLRTNEGKVIQALDKALITGDVLCAYNSIFDVSFCGYEQLPDEWKEDALASFKVSGLYNDLSISDLFAIRFLCEWAICDFRYLRNSLNNPNMKDETAKDMSRIYLACSVLVMRRSEIEKDGKNNEDAGKLVKLQKGATTLNPNSMHKLIVAWIDQHEILKGEAFEKLQLLLCELVAEGIFCPNSYVRHLIVDGVLEGRETAADISRGTWHRRILRHLPVPSVVEINDWERNMDPFSAEATRLFNNERRFALHNLAPKTTKKFENCLKPDVHSQDAAVSMADGYFNHSIGMNRCTLSAKSRGSKNTRHKSVRLSEVKQAVSAILQFPEYCNGQILPAGTTVALNKNSGKRNTSYLHPETVDATPGCDECSKNKRQKLSAGNKMWTNGGGLDQEETWWLKKGPKIIETVKSDPPLKPPKQNIRGRPKIVRKTQSLAQLANPRIESVQGAAVNSSSDSKSNCPYHRPMVSSIVKEQFEDKMKPSFGRDMRSIGFAVRQLCFPDKRLFSTWLTHAIHNIARKKSAEQSAPQNSANYNSLSAPSRMAEVNSGRWRLTEARFAAVIFLLDIAMDLRTLVKLLLWLLPMVSIPSEISQVQGFRSVSVSPWNKESFVVFGDNAILSALQRYEGVLTSANLLPEALSAVMDRTSSVMAAVPGGRTLCSSLLHYVHDLMRKYGGLAVVQSWERNWKSTSDPRLAAELEALKGGESENGMALIGMSVSGAGEERDDPVPQRIPTRLARVATMLKDTIQRGINEVISQSFAKDREQATAVWIRDLQNEGTEELGGAAHRIVTDVMGFIRQNGGGNLQTESALVSAAVAAIVSNAASATANVLESLGLNNNHVLNTVEQSSIRCARHVLQLHVQCLRYLREALDEHQCRVLESALTTEASSVLAGSLPHCSSRAPRSQFHLSPETPENVSLSNDLMTTSSSSGFGKGTSGAVAVALVASAAVHGIASLDRVIAALKLKEAFQNLLPKSSFCSSNGISRTSVGTVKTETEVSLYWFRVLIADCRNVFGGLIADLLGEASVLALNRMQRLLPLTTVFSPAFNIFGTILRRQVLTGMNIIPRDEALLQLLIPAVNDVIGHKPFCDASLQDTQALYRMMLSFDSGDHDYAAMLDMQNLSTSLKIEAMVPFCSRLFLHAILDQRPPGFLIGQEGETWANGRQDIKPGNRHDHSQVNEMVQILDNVQPATFHWQWVELRLLLNEEVFVERLENQNLTAADAIRSISADSSQLCECEKTFIAAVLTRLLVRPDAAALYSEVVHSLGRAMDDYLIMYVRWVMENSEALQGRKSLRQCLDTYALKKGFSLRTSSIKSWGWQSPKIQEEVASPEEGELSQEGSDWKGKESREDKHLMFGERGNIIGFIQPFATEKALTELVLPCLARSSNATLNGFVNELVKQIGSLENHISLITRPHSKSPATSTASMDGLLGKYQVGRRGQKAVMGVDDASPGARRRSGSCSESNPASVAALRSSLWLRLQFLLPLLPIIYQDRERNVRAILAPVILRLLGTRVVQEVAEGSYSEQGSLYVKEMDWNAEAASAAAAMVAGDGLFNRLIDVLHALLSNTWAAWLKPRIVSKTHAKGTRDVPPFDREVAEQMQVELDHMQISRSIRIRLQAALPPPPPSASGITLSMAPPQIPASANGLLQSCLTECLSSASSSYQKSQYSVDSANVKKNVSQFQDTELVVDPWTLLEDGTGSWGPTGNGASLAWDNGNTRACSWLKGAIKVRRTDLTYVGTIDGDA